MKVETLITRRLLRAGLLTSILVLHATFARAQVPNCAPGLDASYVASVHSGSFPGSSFAFVSHAGFDNCASLPTGTPSSDLPQEHVFGSSVDITTDCGCLRVPAAVQVRVVHTNDVGTTRFYSLEMQQLDLSGGDFPAGVMIRESPTLASTGQLALQPAAGGGYHMESFFDVFTETSTDGGATWIPGTNSTHMVQTNAPEVFSLTNRLPQLQARYANPGKILYCTNNSCCCTNGIIVSNIIHSAFSTNQPPPPLHGTIVHSFSSTVNFQISLDGGTTFSQQQAPANVTVRVTHSMDADTTQYFDTEMVQLDLAGGTLPPGIMLRGSPTKLSLGKSHIRPVTGGYMIGSYFDIYTELSTDFGATWIASCCPKKMSLTPPATNFTSAAASLSPLGLWHLNETNVVPSNPRATNRGSLGPTGNGTYIGGAPATGALTASANRAVRFDGALGVLYNPLFSATTPFTVEAWVKAAATTTGTPCPLSCGTFGANFTGWAIYQNGSSGWNLRMYKNSGANTTISINNGGATVPGVWYHLAAVYSGPSAVLYVNGIGSGAATNAPFVPDLNGPLTLGMRSDTNFNWSGSVDEFVIYPSALSTVQVQQDYQNGTNATSGIPYDQLVLSHNPAIFLRLDELGLPIATNSGTLGSSANGLYEPGSTPGVPGIRFNGLIIEPYACRFNGAFGCIDVSSSGLDLLGPITVMAWCKPNAANGIFQTIIGKGDTSYRLDMDWNGYPRFADGLGNPEAVGPTRIDDGQWHFLTGVYDGVSSNNLYLDGSLVGSSGPATVPGNSSDVWIGAAPDHLNVPAFNGDVAEVGIFNGALSAGQVLGLYNSAFWAPAPTPNPVIGSLHVGSQVQIMWGFGTLQSSGSAAGPYNDVMPQPTSPYVFAPTAPKQFYRVKR